MRTYNYTIGPEVERQLINRKDVAEDRNELRRELLLPELIARLHYTRQQAPTGMVSIRRARNTKGNELPQ